MSGTVGRKRFQCACLASRDRSSRSTRVPWRASAVAVGRDGETIADRRHGSSSFLVQGVVPGRGDVRCGVPALMPSLGARGHQVSRAVQAGPEGDSEGTALNQAWCKAFVGCRVGRRGGPRVRSASRARASIYAPAGATAIRTSAPTTADQAFCVAQCPLERVVGDFFPAWLRTSQWDRSNLVVVGDGFPAPCSGGGWTCSPRAA